MATFELLNSESGNVLGCFATEALALAAVCEAIERNGRHYGEALVLGRENSRGRSRVIASGPHLVARAMEQRQASPGSERRRAPS